jgi:hypothetical protein
MVLSLKSREDALASRVSELEQILREWSDVFGAPSAALLGAGVPRAGASPALLARRLIELSDAATAASARERASRAALEKECADLRAALRDAGRVSREGAAAALGDLKAEADAAVAAERATAAAARAELADVRVRYADDVRAAIAAGVAEQTHHVRSAAAAARDAHAESVREVGAARDRAEARAVRTEGAAADARDAEARAERAAADARGALAACEAARAADAADFQRRLDALDTQWRKKWSATNQAWETSASVHRTAELEGTVARLERRVRDLSTLSNALQATVAARNNAVGADAVAPAPPALPHALHRASKGDSRASVSASVSAPWRARAFGAAPALVAHAGAPTRAGATPVATEFIWVR